MTKKSISLELGSDLYEWLVDYAEEGDTSVSAVVRFALEELREDCEAPSHLEVCQCACWDEE